MNSKITTSPASEIIAELNKKNEHLENENKRLEHIVSNLSDNVRYISEQLEKANQVARNFEDNHFFYSKSGDNNPKINKKNVLIDMSIILDYITLALDTSAESIKEVSDNE